MNRNTKGEAEEAVIPAAWENSLAHCLPPSFPPLLIDTHAPPEGPCVDPAVFLIPLSTWHPSIHSFIHFYNTGPHAWLLGCVEQDFCQAHGAQVDPGVPTAGNSPERATKQGKQNLSQHCHEEGTPLS